jgi:hypothetical protein
MAGGIILATLGSFLVLPGAWLATNEFGDAATPSRSPAARFALLGVAGGLLVPGITLAAVGGRYRSAMATKAPSARAALTVAIRAGSAALTWTF